MRKIFTLLTLLVAFGFVLAAPAAISIAASADPPAQSTTDPAVQSVCSAIDCSDSHGPSVGSLLRLVLNVLSFLIGFIAVVMIVYNGFRFVTSGGESGKVASARSGILYALVGLAVAALAQVLVHFVIGQVNSTGGTPAKPTAAYCKTHPKAKGC